MKILYFSSRECWPLTTGARLRDYHFARQLAARCPLTYVGLRQPRDPGPFAPPPDAGFAQTILTRGRSFTVSKLIAGFRGPQPVTVLNYSSPRVAAALAAILADGAFDTVQLEGVHLVEYVPVIRAAASRPAILADWHNLESEILARYAVTTSSLPRRLMARRTVKLLARAEQRLLAGCDAHSVASDRERRALATWNPAARIHVVPNGVDAAYYAGNAAPGGAARLVFVGSMDYHANVDAAVWFVREVWPELRRRSPQLSFTIVGRDPAPEVRALAAGGVEVTGTVEDVRPYYAGALAVVAPLRVGSGTRLKILEALAAGVPVISTALGAEGLEVEAGANILLAENAAQFAAAVNALQTKPDLRSRLVEAGRALVRRLYDWSILGAQLYRIHCETLERAR